MLNYSTFQTTHNNAMKQKNETIIYAGKGKVSETLQRLLFGYGYTWNNGQNAIHLNDEIVLYVYSDKLTLDFDYYADNIVCNIDGTKFLYKVIELCENNQLERNHVNLQSENERLKREITQLRDELDAKSAESFPEGYDWHNPNGLNIGQIGFRDGWRLLLESEITKERSPTYEIQAWSLYNSEWTAINIFSGSSKNITYRTKLPLPSRINTPTSQPDTKTVSESTDDDFPTPERQEKEAGLKWFLEYLKRCKEVSFFTNEGIYSCTFKYGQSSMGYFFGEKDGKIGVRGRNGEFIDITITQINP